MSGAAHLERHLGRASIEAIAKERGFASEENVEKFLIDFEVLYHMQRAIPTAPPGAAWPCHYTWTGTPL